MANALNFQLDSLPFRDWRLMRQPAQSLRQQDPSLVPWRPRVPPASLRDRIPTLPKLIFGDHLARTEQGFHGMVDRFSHLTPGCDYDSKARPGFFYKGNVIEVGDVVINQTYYSHMLAVSSVKDHNILIPLAGVHHGLWRGQAIEAQGEQGYFIPANDRFQFETNLDGLAGSLIIKYDLGHLNRVLLAMTGGQLSLPSDDQVRPMPLKAGTVHFKQMFLKLLSQIDDCAGDAALLQLTGFDDAFYRLLALTLFPAHFLNPALSKGEQQATRGHDLMRMFERYVDAHIDKALTMSELEASLGVTARALQYACLKRHGCSPRTYIRNRKLQLAHERLSNRREPIKIASLAFELGFSSQSQFSKYFRERFGLLPSAL